MQEYNKKDKNIQSLKLVGEKTRLRMGLLFVAIMLSIFMVLLIFQLFRIQIVQGDYYTSLAAQNHFKRNVIFPERGRILDTNGEILAMTTYVYTIGATPSAVRSFHADLTKRPSKDRIIKDLAEILQTDQTKITAELNKKDKVYVILAKEVEKPIYDKLKEYLQKNSIRGISIDITDRRYYPNKDLASAVIGYANKREQWISGVIGLEKQYDKELSGQAGFSFGEVDHYTGRQLPYSEAVIEEAVPGQNVVLHLNLELQRYVQEQTVKFAKLYDAQEGAGAIVMNAKTGAIIAMAQSNNVDLNQPLSKPSQLLSVDDNRVEADRLYQQKLFEETNQEYEKSYSEAAKPLLEKIRELEEQKAKILRREVNSQSDPEQEANKKRLEIENIDLEIDNIQKDIDKRRAELDELLEKRKKRFEEDMALTLLPNPDDWNPNEHINDMYFLNNRAWQNILVQTPYEPGSTLKTFTVASALEEHVISQNETFSDAPIFVPGWDQYPISCWYAPNNHGNETAEQALGNSCNPVMVQIAERLGAEKFQRYIKSLGLYEPTGIDLPYENVGLLHEKLQLIDLATFSFGEQNTITPIQLLSSYTAITNNGVLLKPQMVKYITNKQGHIIKEFVRTPKRQVYSRETTEKILAMLRSAVTKGIVKNLDVPGYQVGGKTGTSTKLTNESRPDPNFEFLDNYSVGSVVAVFPVSDPQYLVFTFLKNPRSSQSVAQQVLAANIIRELGHIMNIRKIYAPNDVEKLLSVKTLATQTGVSLNSLADHLLARGFDYEIEEGLSPQEPFYTSYPPSGTQFHGYPILYISRDGSKPTEKIEVPDFKGMNFITAGEYAKSKRVNVYFHGDIKDGRVVRQSEAVLDKDGNKREMTPFSVINLYFEKKEGESSATEFIFRNDPVPEPDNNLPVRYLFKKQTYSDWNAKTHQKYTRP